MSADNINADTLQLPVWTVNGPNWHIHIELDEMNAQFDAETQAMEAASKAILVLKGKDDTRSLTIDNGEDKAFLGPVLIVHLKDTDPMQGQTPFTHEAFANQGFYKESAAMEKVLNEKRAAIAQDYQQFKNLMDALAKHKPKKLKKVVKKKNPRKKKR